MVSHAFDIPQTGCGGFKRSAHSAIPILDAWRIGWVDLFFDKFKRIFDQKSIPKHLLNEVLEVQIHQNLLKGGKRRAKKGKGAPKTATRRPKGSQAAPKSSKMSPKLIQNYPKIVKLLEKNIFEIEKNF